MVIELKNDLLTVQFKEMGGTISSIKDKDGIEYIWQGNPEYWSGQAPVLFPICGSLRCDKAAYREDSKSLKNGTIARHGLVRKNLFRYKKIDDSRVSFTVKSDQTMYNEYPYDFELEIIYSLVDATVKVEYVVRNFEKFKRMPFFIGGHPGFNCPLINGENYEDYYLEFAEVETCSVPRQFPDTGLLDCLDRKPFLNGQKTLDLDYSLFESDAVTLDQLKSRNVKLLSRNHSKGIELDFQDFPYLVIWSTTNRGPFIAIEPWSGLSTSLEESDFFEEKRNVQFVEPSFEKMLHFEITILA